MNGVYLSNAICLHESGHLQEAEQLYQAVLAGEPNNAAALHLLGVICQQRGEHAEALDSIGRAIASNPAKAVYRNNYGAALLSLERFAEAKDAFSAALGLSPNYPDALANLGLAEAALGRQEAALACYWQALQIDSQHRDARRRLATLLVDLDRSDEAIGVLREPLAANAAAAYADFGDLCLRLNRWADAAEAYAKAVELDPNQAGMHFNFGQALEGLLDMASARRHFARAVELRPEKPLWRLRAEICGPTVFQGAQEIDEYCETVEKALFRFGTNMPSPPAPLPEGEGRREADGTRSVPATLDDVLEAAAFPTFALSYLGRNVRRLKERFTAVYEPYFRDVSVGNGLRAVSVPAERHLLAERRILAERRGGRSLQRIGFVVTRRHEGIFARCMGGILRHLDTRRFEPVVLAPTACIDPLKKQLASDGLRYVAFRDTFNDAVRTIRETVCDLIYYWEVGSDVLNYFLPFARLAPVQCTSHGSLTTTGVPNIDYFFSSELMEQPSPPAPLPEREGSNAHYSERLWKSRTLLMCQERLPSVSSAWPGYFGLPDGRRPYGCIQNPLKLHPDFDALLAGILATDPLATIVLLGDRNGHVTKALQERFARTVSVAGDRIVFVPRQRFADYCRLLQACGVLLDPPHYGAGSSCYDIFSYNLPMVTLPTELMPGRVALAFYRKMQFEELVASSPEDYVSKAVRVASDVDYRRHVTEQIAARSDVLFNDIEAVREHERFFEEALARTS